MRRSQGTERGEHMSRPWVAEKMVEAHRRELAATIHPRVRTARRTRTALPGKITHHSASGLPLSDGRAVRGVVRPKVGAWLIHAGTRLGGAHMRTT
jgi:hypothetical protein